MIQKEYFVIQHSMHIKKSGRPKKYITPPVSFGIKISAEDKEKIKQLSHAKAKPANEVLMELVSKELGTLGLTNHHRISAEDLLKMSPTERSKTIKAQASLHVKNFEYISDNQSILDY